MNSSKTLPYATEVNVALLQKDFHWMCAIGKLPDVKSETLLKRLFRQIDHGLIQ